MSKQKLPRKSASKPFRKTAKKAPVHAAPAKGGALYKVAARDLRKLLVYTLQDPSLRKRAGVKVDGKDEMALELNIEILSDRDMKALNRKFRKKNETTDVLSFPAPAVFRQHGFLGDLFIGAGPLKEQAKTYRHPVARELRVLMVHGFLHLLGFDHETGPKNAKAMAVWEKKIAEGVFGEELRGLISRESS